VSHLRKPFYDYAIARDGAGRYVGVWRFAEWALAFMPNAAPARAFDAYVAAHTDALRQTLQRVSL
jgi:hypothetical protein